MNRRSFTNTLLAGGILVPCTSHGLLAGSAAQAGESSTLLSALSRTLALDGRAATVFRLATPNGAPGLTLRASETDRLGLINSHADQAATAQVL